MRWTYKICAKVKKNAGLSSFFYEPLLIIFSSWSQPLQTLQQTQPTTRLNMTKPRGRHKHRKFPVYNWTALTQLFLYIHCYVHDYTWTWLQYDQFSTRRVTLNPTSNSWCCMTWPNPQYLSHKGQAQKKISS